VRRRLFNFAAAVSLVLCLAMLGFWIWAPEERSYGGWSGLGEIGVSGRFGGWYSHYVPSSWKFHWWNWGRFSLTVMKEVSGGLYEPVTPPMVLQFAFPYWFPAVIFAVLPSAWFLNRMRRRRNDPGLCPKCGYSLTGNTSGICPECGTRRVLSMQARKAPGLRDSQAKGFFCFIADASLLRTASRWASARWRAACNAQAPAA
jgi:hypothetical protein